MFTEVVKKLLLKASISNFELLFEILATVFSKKFYQVFIPQTILLMNLHTKTYVGLNIQISGTL